ncbi:hypothetical protein [Clostridium perfringens]|uniref:hypothetical protein n=1 Tax=Clostridium perfringens TaxID=1502 RepID=UPI0018E48616|nr:hypothetical protein [Clostridium perfringens]MBI5996805.1 hypothetical protein [Clostridium perfringens]MCC5421376.1 hypothetical protein [Clostridium perfringens]MCC5430818.1 hypothetical protein [Clostridium perfringens]MCC5445306.1 hypothetical protein [Clostridium perfringens]MCC5448265.1 hypothetical protein [Clostridium perfringens]
MLEIDLLKEELKEKDKIIEDLRERCDRYFNLYMQEKELKNRNINSELKDLRKNTKELKELVKNL